MKRIEFIAPVEAMRGNLSGAQKLQYPTDNQGAYEGPAGAVNYARNYSPRFIGAKIAKTGKKFFAVKTKTANHLTVKSKKAMAIMGGTGALIAFILRDKTKERYTNLYGAWVAAQEMGDTRSFRKFLDDAIRPMLANRQESKRVQVGSYGETIYNPWIAGGGVSDYNLPVTLILKFWSELGPVGSFLIKVTLPDGGTAIAPWISGQTFAAMSGGFPQNGVYSSVGESIGAMVASGSTAVQFRILPSLTADKTLYIVADGEEKAVLADATPSQFGVYVIKNNA